MANAQQQTPAANAGTVDHFDAIVIGAGVSGLYQLYRLRQLGLSVRVPSRPILSDSRVKRIVGARSMNFP